MMRPVGKKDIQQVEEIFKAAKSKMKERKIPQWLGTYPNTEVVEQDIEQAIGYVFVDKEEIVGYAALQVTPEQNYQKIYGGSWKMEDTPYTTIHRFAIHSSAMNKGYGQQFFKDLEKQALRLGFLQMRVDTHLLNVPMRSLLKKCGYEERGIVFMSDDLTRRVGMQKFLGEKNEEI